MLVRFNVKNFLSFYDRENPFDNSERISHEFSMIPGSVRNKEDHLTNLGKQKLLKFAAIYGANAAGKSNIITAIQVYKTFVLTGTTPAGVSNMYCMTKPENKDKVSYFEAEFIVDGNVYAYGFEVILFTGEITSEWLYRINPSSEKLLFEKETGGKYELGSELEDISDLKVLLKSFEGSNGLFLSFMNKNMAGFYKAHKKALFLHRIFDWFFSVLSVNFPDTPLQDASFLLDNASLEEVSMLMKAFGTGITEVTAEEIDFQKVAPLINPKVMQDVYKRRDEIANAVNSDHQYPRSKITVEMVVKTQTSFYIIRIGDGEDSIKATELKFKHAFECQEKFPFNFESDGTQRLFDLLEILLSKQNKVYVLDELDRRLHPSLTYEFVKIFFRYAKSRNIQLIVTSHESRLLDFDLLRRDEIWFIEKDKEGESCIYSLEQYNERFDKKIDKAYLEGRYGGVPVFTSLFPVEKDVK